MKEELCYILGRTGVGNEEREERYEKDKRSTEAQKEKK